MTFTASLTKTAPYDTRQRQQPPCVPLNGSSSRYSWVIAGHTGMGGSQPTNTPFASSTLAVYDQAYMIDPLSHSLAELWLTSGTNVASNCGGPTTDPLQSIEAGWITSRGLEGDDSPHLFTFSTLDGYWMTGCYDQRACTTISGGLDAGRLIIVAGAIASPSMILPHAEHDFIPNAGHEYAGTIPETKIQVVRTSLINADGTTVSGGNVWAIYVDFRPYGYYPADDFSALHDVATLYRVGGEIHTSTLPDPSPGVEMGSGIRPLDENGTPYLGGESAYHKDSWVGYPYTLYLGPSTFREYIYQSMGSALPAVRQGFVIDNTNSAHTMVKPIIDYADFSTTASLPDGTLYYGGQQSYYDTFR